MPSAAHSQGVHTAHTWGYTQVTRTCGTDSAPVLYQDAGIAVEIEKGPAARPTDVRCYSCRRWPRSDVGVGLSCWSTLIYWVIPCFPIPCSLLGKSASTKVPSSVSPHRYHRVENSQIEHRCPCASAAPRAPPTFRDRLLPKGCRTCTTENSITEPKLER